MNRIEPSAPKFEGTLPRHHFFAPEKPVEVAKKAKSPDWRSVVVTTVLAATFIAALAIVNREGPLPPRVPLLSMPVSPDVAPSPAPPAPPVEYPQGPRLVLRAQPPEPEVRRGLPVEGQLYVCTMPDGSHPLIRYMGAVRDFSQLPKNPNPYDYYSVANSGHSWVFMQPAGFSAPSWVDP